MAEASDNAVPEAPGGPAGDFASQAARRRAGSAGEPDAVERCARLTRREREILAVLASGATTDEAALQLRMPSGEIRTHVENIKATLRARSKLEAVLIASRAGAIRAPNV